MDQSLKSRMAARAAELERQQTEVFPVPGWERLFGVELRALSHQTRMRIQEKNEKVRDTALRGLYNMADQIVTATEGFHEATGEGGYAEDVMEGDTWVTMVEAAFPGETPDQGWTPRQACIRLVSDKRMDFLVADWAEWSRTVRSDVDEEVGADFVQTG